VASSMVFMTSTNGTCERTARKRSGAGLQPRPSAGRRPNRPRWPRAPGRHSPSGQVLHAAIKSVKVLRLTSILPRRPGLPGHAAADVRIGHHHSAIEQAERFPLNRWQRVAIGAVAVDVQGLALPRFASCQFDKPARSAPARHLSGGVNALAGVRLRRSRRESQAA